MKGTEASLSCVQCFLYLVSPSVNVSIFHSAWLHAFWTDLVFFPWYEVPRTVQFTEIGSGREGARGWRPEEGRGVCAQWTESQFEVTKESSGDDGGGGQTILGTPLMLLTRTLKVDETVNSMLYVFYHNKKDLK